ncbi:MAG: GNAT family N-acetyltransferase, partial [Bacteroidota bacterium]
MNITTAKTDAELRQILALQKKNLPQSLSPDQQTDQGFVSADHSLETLQAMGHSAAHIIAKDGEIVAGYALAMTREYSKAVPLLTGIFEFQDTLLYQGKTLDKHDYIVMGQVCVDENYRGQQLVDKMYAHYRTVHSTRWPLLVTAISPRNTRSI